MLIKNITKNFLIFNFIITISLYAGDSKYTWSCIGKFCLGELSNNLIFYWDNIIYSTSIPGFVTYWKWYIFYFILVLFFLVLFKRIKKEV